MAHFPRWTTCFLAATLLATPAFATRPHHSTASASHAGRTHKTSGKASQTRGKAASHKLHGQQAIAPERVTEIQQALIREHYLSSDANGQWDSTTQNAMQKFQQDNGWQTKLLPDSRALKKLGLGPDYSKAINATAISSVTPPAQTGTTNTAQAAGFAAAAGVNQ